MSTDGKVVVYRLSTRFLQQDGKPPEVSKQIVYYSLAVGHHVGVIDTFKAALTWPLGVYEAWVASLPEGEARRKLDGVRRFGEIQVDSGHTRLLRGAIAADPGGPGHSIAEELDAQLRAIEAEPALYLMVRRVP
jgi:hydrogenase-4 component J